MKPEAQLLLLCARWVLAAGEREAVLRLLESNLDWDEVGRLASRHSLVPLLYRHLDALGAQRVPKDAFASLWARYEAIARRNRFLAVELARILHLFESKGIAAVPYKGPTLALQLYGDVTLREFGDLDILMRSGDVLQAKELLTSQGYTSQITLAPHLESALLRSKRHYELPLVNDARAAMVELHWRTDPDLEVAGLEDDRWWAGLRRIPLEDTEVRTLGIAELLLILCLHGTKHFWSSLAWLVDVAELIRQHPELDWKWVIETVRDLGCERKLALGLFLARELLGVHLPSEVEVMIRDPEVRNLGARIATTTFESEFQALGVLEMFRLNLRLQGKGQHLRYFLRVTLTPNLGDWQSWSLPRAVSYLYFPLRFARLFTKYLIKPFARLTLRRAPPTAKPRIPPPQPHSTG